MKTHILIVIIVSILIGSIVVNVQAQNENNVEEIVVSVTQIPTPIHQIGASISVLTAEDLRLQQSTNLQGALDTLAGVSVYQNGGLGKISNVFIRGLTGKYVNLIIDGIEVNDPVNQQASWQHINVQGIDHIEVLRGSNSVLYGSEAIAGVINLYTKSGGDKRRRFHMEMGSFATYKIEGTMSGQTLDDRLDYGMSIQMQRSQGFSALEADNEDDGYRRLTVAGKFAYEVSDNLSSNFVFRYNQGEVEFDQCGYPYSNHCDTEFQYTLLRWGLLYEQEYMTHEFAVSMLENQNENFTEGQFSSYTQGNRYRVNYKNIMIFDISQFVLGMEHETETYEAKSAFNDSKYNVDNQAISILWQSEPVSWVNLTFAYRLDYHETFKMHETWRVTGRISLHPMVDLRGAIGTGYHAPSLYSLYDPTYGNSSLQPETSISNDIGVIFMPIDDVELEISLFEITIRDRIGYDNNFRAIQIEEKTKSKGIETSLSWRINKAIYLNMNYTYLVAKKDDKSQDIRRPKHQFNVRMNGQITDNLSAYITASFVKDIIDTDFNTYPYQNVALDNYHLVTIGTEYQIKDHVSVYGRIENVLDEEYQTVLGYNSSGRAFFIGMSFGGR